jgi:hypothetical protein
VTTALLPVISMVLGVAGGALVGYLSQRMYEARLLRRYAPIVFCAPMSTTPPAVTELHGTVTDWTEVDA